MSGSAQMVAPPSSSSSNRWPKVLALAAVLLIALTFVWMFPFHYYLHYSEAGFTDPTHGAPNYWQMRGWLMLHITGGVTALLIGPGSSRAACARDTLDSIVSRAEST